MSSLSEKAYMLLLTIGHKYFSHADQWAVFEPVYATVPEHWHRVASDLGENTEDYEQILKTPRMIIGNHKGTIARVFPIQEMPESQDRGQ